MLAKLIVPAVPEVRAVTAMVGTTRSDRKEELESDYGATFHMSHTRAGMSAYKKASPGTNVEIADSYISVVGSLVCMRITRVQKHWLKILRVLTAAGT